MSIKSAQYKTGTHDDDNLVIICTIDNQVMYVPVDPANRHYAAILEWVAEGNTIQEAD